MPFPNISFDNVKIFIRIKIRVKISMESEYCYIYGAEQVSI